MKYIILNNKIIATHADDQKVSANSYNENAEIIKISVIYNSDYIFTDDEMQTLRAQTLLQKNMTPLDFVKSFNEFGVTAQSLWTYLQSNQMAMLALFTCDRVYRGDSSLDGYAEALNITSAQLDEIFNTKGDL